jgi:putative ABC transport system permease protein
MITNDIRHAFRVFRKSPAVYGIAVLTLVLGIGANTAIFSVVKEVLLTPLPFREPERLVMVWEEASLLGFPRNTPAPANYADWKAQNQVFESMAASTWETIALTGGGEPEKITGHGVTADFFQLLGIHPLLGRTFTPDEDKPGANKVVVLSHGLWERRFGGDRAILGRQLLLNGEKHTVIGVMPKRFQFLEPFIGLWRPAALGPEELANRNGHYLRVVARLKPGVTLEEARSDMRTVMARIAAAHPDSAGRLGIVVLPLKEQLTGDARTPLLVLLGAVACVLLIACANLANLLLSQAVSRSREVAIRTALGAGRGDIVRQFLIESVLLAVMGAGGGLLLAYWAFDFLTGLIPASVSLTTEPRLDSVVLAFTFGIALLTGLGFGLVPAYRSARQDPTQTMRAGTARGGVGLAEARFRGLLVSTEVALAAMLLVGAALLVQTMSRLTGQYEPLNAERVLTVKTDLPQYKYDTPAKRTRFYSRVLERVGALPGVLYAGYTTAVPLEWKGGTTGFEIAGQPRNPSVAYDAIHRQISADYLRAIGIPLKRGRHFTAADSEKSQRVAIVNETMARQFWPNVDPIGERIRFSDESPWVTIIGVAGDVRQMGADAPVKAEMYLPYPQIAEHFWFAPSALVVRTTTGDPLALAPLVRAEVRAVDPDQPVANVRTMDEVLGEETLQRRIGTTLLGVFAVLALGLACLGIYGVLAYFVVQHTPEIGVRVALGAKAADILGLVLRRSAIFVGLGLAAGLFGAIALSRVIRGLLFDVSATDPATFAAVAVILGAVAFLASYVPARRAATIDPAVALRVE